MKQYLDRWQVTLLSIIMLLIAVMLGLVIGGQAAYAWSPGPGQNVVVDNGYSFSGKASNGAERPMLTLLNCNAARLNAPPAGAIFFTVANAERMRISNSGNVGINDTTPTEGHLVVRALASGQNCIYGQSHGSPSSGVYGINTTTGNWGILGSHLCGASGTNGNGNVGALGTGLYGAYGKNDSGQGVHGESTSGEGVHGQSSSAEGVRGESSSAEGVYGWSDSGEGVHGQSVSYHGVYGTSGSGYAGYFDGKVKINGSLTTGYLWTDTNYTLTDSDSVIAADSHTFEPPAVLTITLPEGTGLAGRTYTIKKVDASANEVKVQGDSGDTIDGAATYTLDARWKYVTIVGDGSNWLIVANN